MQTDEMVPATSKLVEAEVEMGLFEEYLDSESPDMLMSCKRISYCSCNCDRCSLIG
jgi:hypothetical protein